MNWDEVRYTIHNLRQRSMRSWLTVLSILIGVTAIFAILAFGLGLQNYINSLAEESGTDKLFIQARGIGAPGTDDAFTLSKDEIEFVDKVKGVKQVAGIYMKPGEIEHNDETKYNFVMGLNMDKLDFQLEAFTIEIMKGRNLQEDETGKVVLGYNYQLPDKIFEDPVRVGDRVKINGEKFEVVGFYSEVGNPTDDGNVYLTQAGMEQLYTDIEDKFGFLMVQSARNIDPGELADKITEDLREERGEEEGQETFFVQTFADAIETFQNIFNILNGILVLIALVSVIVASVNIMNTMYTAVIERTREIGIMKAVGARNSDIMFIFILESGILGMVGGVFGVILGYLIAELGGYVAAVSGFSLLQPVFPWYLIAGCILFAFFVGSISGILPARHAARQNPVTALRYDE